MSHLKRFNEEEVDGEINLHHNNIIKLKKQRQDNQNSLTLGYIDSIDRRKLDFDIEKICCITLSTTNIYCCLSCGKYFQGKNHNSPAFKHMLDDDHHLFLNMESLKIYSLPENYEMIGIESLNVIKYAANPTYDPEDLKTYPLVCYDLNLNRYLNGFVGLNNISQNSYQNVVIQLLSHIIPIRNYFLLESMKMTNNNGFIEKLSSLIRKMWSPKLFKNHVSPYEFIKYIESMSNQKLGISKDPRKFLLYLVTMILSKSSDRKLKKLFLQQFQGQIKIMTTRVNTSENLENKTVKFTKTDDGPTVKSNKFWILTLDLPPMPLFKTDKSTNVPNQIKLETLLEKFNGISETHTEEHINTYKVTYLPKYLILHINRFDSHTEFPVKNRNQTLVEFEHQLVIENCNYQLVSNIIHGSFKDKLSQKNLKADEQSIWKIQVKNVKTDEWFEFDGTEVKQREKQLLFLNESYMQVWEKM